MQYICPYNWLVAFNSLIVSAKCKSEEISLSFFLLILLAKLHLILIFVSSNSEPRTMIRSGQCE